VARDHQLFMCGDDAHRTYIREHFEDLPEIANWSWTADFSEPTAPPPLAVGQPRAALFTDS
jgi:xylulose-5-phosphate/fructose-6-phosphate phosphoketolase